VQVGISFQFENSYHIKQAYRGALARPLESIGQLLGPTCYTNVDSPSTLILLWSIL